MWFYIKHCNTFLSSFTLECSQGIRVHLPPCDRFSKLLKALIKNYVRILNISIQVHPEKHVAMVGNVNLLTDRGKATFSLSIKCCFTQENYLV
jgi:hypothetical protein